MSEVSRLKSLLGEFVIEFERILVYQRGIIVLVCNPSKVPQVEKYISTLMTSYTAQTVSSSFSSILSDMDANLHAEFKSAINLFNEVINLRNKLLHGSFLEGVKFENDKHSLNESYITIKKWKSSGKGLKVDSSSLNFENFSALINHVRCIRDSFQKLLGLIEVREYPTLKEVEGLEFEKYNELTDSLKKLPSRIQLS